MCRGHSVHISSKIPPPLTPADFDKVFTSNTEGDGYQFTLGRLFPVSLAVYKWQKDGLMALQGATVRQDSLMALLQ